MNNREIIIGLVQQSNTADIEANKQKLGANIAECVTKGAELVVLQELHDSLYFCQTEDVNLFELAETIPGTSTGFYGELAKKHKIVLVCSLFEKRAAGLYHNTAVVFEKTALLPGNTGRCTSLMTRGFTKSFILHPEILVLLPFKRLSVNWVYWFVGISGTPKPPA